MAKWSISRRFSGVRFKTVGQQVIQQRGTEGVSGAGGLDDATQVAGRDKDGSGVAVEAVAALSTGGDVEFADIGVH